MKARQFEELKELLTKAWFISCCHDSKMDQQMLEFWLSLGGLEQMDKSLLAAAEQWRDRLTSYPEENSPHNSKSAGFPSRGIKQNF